MTALAISVTGFLAIWAVLAFIEKHRQHQERERRKHENP